ncbi:MAG: histidinol dehydrogenase [Acidobacteriota bacterium]
MSDLRIVNATGRAGARLLARLERRGDGVLDPKVLQQTERILKSVKTKGDRGLLAAVRRFDGVSASKIDQLRMVPQRTDRRQLPPGFEHALERAIVAVERYHEEQVHGGARLQHGGVELVETRHPLRRVGVYIPGGRATYPSSVVMTVVPAKLAGVEEIVVTTPMGGFQRSAALRHTLERLGVTEVWAAGGAHAVGALAYGTESIRRVDKIVGPGNAWVTAAKYLVSSHVAIDGLAGPSEVVIGASGDDVNPAWLAADLLAQAEHDPLAMSVLVTDRARTAKAVRREVKLQLRSLPTAKVARASLAGQGAAVVVPDMEVGLHWIEKLAPEHLQLVGAEAEALADRVRNAGATFVGAHSPVAFGDYLAGPSHVLPTGGHARFSSSLGVEDFVRRSHIVRFGEGAASRSAKPVSILADVEGLPAHARAARFRVSEGDA